MLIFTNLTDTIFSRIEIDMYFLSSKTGLTKPFF